MGAQVSKIEDTIHDTYKKVWPQAWWLPRVFFSSSTKHLRMFRFLAPSFLASLGAAGFVGYAFAQTKAVPSSSNVSFIHLLGVAGKDLASIP